MSELVIRGAEEGDLPALLELYQQLHAGEAPPSLERARSILTAFRSLAGSAILLGDWDYRTVSSCAIAIIPNLTRGGRSYGLIENVVTAADTRGRGFGKALLNAACEIAWKSDCYKVMLMTGQSDAATIRFYESAGFEQSKTGFQKRQLPPRPQSA